MNDWEGLRIAVVTVAWLTVAGGLILAAMWVAYGGGRAIGPEDQLMADSGVPLGRSESRYTAFSSAQVGMHGFFGITTAGLLTYAAGRSGNRGSGYLAVLVVAAITISLGLLMFSKWRSSRRPSVDGDPAGDHGPKVEDKLPRVVVYLHGAGAAGIVVLIGLLLVVE